MKHQNIKKGQEEVKNKYLAEFNKILKTHEKGDIETECVNIKLSRMEASERTIGLRKRKTTKEWFDDECEKREKQKSIQEISGQKWEENKS